MTRTELTPRTQHASIVTAAFGQNLVLTIVTTFLLLYLLQYAHVSTAGLAVVTRLGDGGTAEPMPAPSPPTRIVDPEPTPFDPRTVADLPAVPSVSEDYRHYPWPYV